MNRFQTALPLALCALLAVACASTPKSRITADKVSQIQVGQTTKAEIQQWFGAPTGRQFSAGSGETWTYAQGASTASKAGRGIGGALLGAAAGAAGPAGAVVPRGGSSSSGENTNLTIVFDNAGRVADYNYASRR